MTFSISPPSSHVFKAEEVIPAYCSILSSGTVQATANSLAQACFFSDHRLVSMTGFLFFIVCTLLIFK